MDPARKVEAIFAFSKAVDSLDNKDKAEAKKQIEVAKAIDPGNAAVAYYAAKLSGGSPRFQVEIDKYAPSYNPALLGFVDKGGAYTWFSTAGDMELEGGFPTGEYKYKEAGLTMRLGILLPLGKRLGLMAEASHFNQVNAHLNSLDNSYEGLLGIVWEHRVE